MPSRSPCLMDLTIAHSVEVRRAGHRRLWFMSSGLLPPKRAFLLTYSHIGITQWAFWWTNSLRLVTQGPTDTYYLEVRSETIKRKRNMMLLTGFSCYLTVYFARGSVCKGGSIEELGLQQLGYMQFIRWVRFIHSPRRTW